MTEILLPLWLVEAKKDMADRAVRFERSLATLKKTDTNYYRAHVLMAKAYRDAERIFEKALAEQNASKQGGT